MANHNTVVYVLSQLEKADMDYLLKLVCNEYELAWCLTLHEELMNEDLVFLVEHL